MATQLGTRDRIDTTEETRFSELIRHFDDDVKCESRHTLKNQTTGTTRTSPCDKAARYRVRMCNGSRLVCASRYEDIKEGLLHKACKTRCWTVTPI